MDNNDNYYLKDDVYFEPLFNSWYAWTMLLAPIQAARYMTATHLRLMKSFVKNHQLHIAASSQLVGGEFLYSEENQLPEITRIVESTESNCADLIALSDAVVELNNLLRSHTSGESIEPLYEKIPDPLKGLVELTADLDHKPGYRIIESLVYNSDYYRPDLQSVSFGAMSKVDERPFILSTPRTADENHLQLNLNYNSPQLKRLLAARDEPLSKKEIEELFDDVAQKGGLNYWELFSSGTRESRYTPVTEEEGFRLVYTGHAGFLIETQDAAILLDPVIASKDDNDKYNMINFNDLPPKIDFICITHSHQDHFQLETLLQLRHKTNCVLVPKNNGGSLCDPSLKLILKKLDFNVVEMEDLESIPFASGGMITSLPFMGEHGDLNIRSKTAWLVEVMGKKLFLGADATCLDKHVYENIHRSVGDVDVLAIGMECVGAPYTWLYGALSTEKVPKHIKESRRLNGCNGDQASTLVNIFNPKQVCIYALGFETCYKYFMGIEYDENSIQIIETNKMLSLCEEKGIPANKLIGSQQIKFEVGEDEIKQSLLAGS